MKISWFASQNKRTRDLKHLNFNPIQMQLVCLWQIDRYIILLYIQIYFNINIAEVKKTKQKQDDLIYLQNVVIKREIALIKKGNNS